MSDLNSPVWLWGFLWACDCWQGSEWWCVMPSLIQTPPLAVHKDWHPLSSYKMSTSVLSCCGAAQIGCYLPVFTVTGKSDIRIRRCFQHDLSVRLKQLHQEVWLTLNTSTLWCSHTIHRTCAMSDGNCEKLHSLQKLWNHIKQIEKLMPPRDWFNYLNVPDFWNSVWYPYRLICCCFRICLHVRLEVLLPWISNIHWIKIQL